MVKKIKQYLKETWENKLIATMLIDVGVLIAKVSTDATFLIFTLMIGIPMFVYGENVVD